MTDKLDTLLASVREPEPFDESFVQNVMGEVRRVQQKRSYRRSLQRSLRRPMVAGIAAAVVVTGGAVAALVGNTIGDNDETQRSAAPVAVTTNTPAGAPAPATSTDPEGPATSGEPAPSDATSGAEGDHISIAIDELTGLRIETDTHTTTFTVGQPQRVTITLENTGRFPIALNSFGCPLQVVADATADGLVDPALLSVATGGLEWECAGAEGAPLDPRLGSDSVLAPGERTTADASITLPEAGEWAIRGVCSCEFRQVKPTPAPQTDPLSTVGGVLPSPPIETAQPDGRNLVTPNVTVRAD